MSLLERLNYKCDVLAKSAVARGIINCTETVSTARQRLPLESVAFFHNGVKISGECGRKIRFQIGKVEVREFYITQLGWYTTAFNNVDWESQDSALHGKPDMFEMWLFKQPLSFCASGKNMDRWFGSEHTSSRFRPFQPLSIRSQRASSMAATITYRSNLGYNPHGLYSIMWCEAARRLGLAIKIPSFCIFSRHDRLG
jgi:hypothetical protein